MLHRPPMTVLLRILFAGLLAGCASVQSRARAEDLEQRIEAYAAAIRWGYYDSAAHFIHKRHAEPAPVDAASLKRVRVTAYQFTDKTLGANGRTARIAVTFSYYQVDSGVVRTLLDVQSWWYDDQAQHWMLDGDIPRFLD